MECLTSDVVFFSGSSHPELANDITRRLGVTGGHCRVGYTSNRETIVDLGFTPRSRDVYLFQTGSRDVNNVIMELLVMAYACKTSAARRVIGIIPYLPYSKQCQMRKRGCIVSKLLANLLVNAGLTEIITVDLHHKEIQGFFDIPVDNLRASPFLLQYIRDSIPDFKNCVIVAKDPGSARKITSYAERLGVGIAMIHGSIRFGDSETVDGRNSPPIVCPHEASGLFQGQELLPAFWTKKSPVPITVVGDVDGKIAILVDDLLDEVDSFTAAAEVLKEAGATSVYVLATHGLFSGTSLAQIEVSPIDQVVVTNTVPHSEEVRECSKVEVLDISALLAEAIRRTHFQESMSYLFRNVTTED